ncbi:type-1 angiotensin II receptor-like [Protopterus annectens]|uniref:type-1 angiotensin II receptor-like n=1 Tax=Protopterus annectens TaxID=7888 RepID=UPI001CFA353B|nr:type-1 angiotensin II receptor-like [Protopterus annectens]
MGAHVMNYMFYKYGRLLNGFYSEQVPFDLLQRFGKKGIETEMKNTTETDVFCTSIFHVLFYVLPPCYALIMIFGVISNVLVINFNLKTSQKKNSFKVYIINLAITDLMFSSTGMFWSVTFMMHGKWVFGGFSCGFVSYLFYITMYSSILFITAMSLDRCLAVVCPLKWLKVRSMRAVLCISCLIWLMALTVTFATVTPFHRTLFHDPTVGNITLCGIKHPEMSFENWGYLQGVTINVIWFGLSFVSIAVAYFEIFKTLQKMPPLRKTRYKKDELLRLVVIIPVAFFICWFPYNTVLFIGTLVYNSTTSNCFTKRLINSLDELTICFAIGNSLVNPFLYCLLTKDTKQELRRIMCFKRQNRVHSEIHIQLK